ncbi:dihydrodipicolinate synthase family protein [Streptomyces sp. NPDC057543]|uniref:dihydrodipicolinate synthase family protein n=1 Tax=Streptomyces sp. NPDC057543 TaxID=3346163 RepID=UPI0036AAE45C
MPAGGLLMNRHDVDWRGYFAALPTPFTRQGDLDLDAFTTTVRLFVTQGAHGLLVNGSTGEWAAQSTEERKRLAETAVSAAAGQVPVIVAVTHPQPAAAVELARHAEAAGADAIMVPPPPAVRPTPAELHAYITEVAASTGLPCWLYNFPQENATHLIVAQISELVRLPNVVAVKQSIADDSELQATIEAVGDTTLVFGNLLSRRGLAAIADGHGDGHFGSGMPLGSRMPRFFDLAWKGDLEEAGRIADDFAAFMARFKGQDHDGYNWRYGGMQASLKAVMNLQGQPGGYPRRPKLPISDPGTLQEIARALTEFGLAVVD